MNWLTIRNFGRVKYFNLSYVVLVSVPLLAETCHILRSAETLQRYVPVPHFPPLIQYLFVASLLYGLAIALYQYACPAIVKQYESEEQYVTALQPIYERAHPERMLEIVMANASALESSLSSDLVKLQLEVSMWDSGTTGRASAEARLHDSLSALYPSCIQRFLVNSYRQATRKSPLLCGLSGILYLLGTLIMLYLLVERTRIVLNA